MAVLVTAIHVLDLSRRQYVDARHKAAQGRAWRPHI